MLTQAKRFQLRDCRAAHGHVYDLQVYDGAQWVAHGQLAVTDDSVTHDAPEGPQRDEDEGGATGHPEPRPGADVQPRPPHAQRNVDARMHPDGSP